VGRTPGPGVDLVAALPDPLDLPDGSVGVIRAVNVLERIPSKVPLINELYRLLAPGGMLLTLTPSSDGRGAYQNPAHTAYYNENSFWYYTDDEYRVDVPGIRARFQSSRLVTYYPTEWHAANLIAYVAANLIAVKPGADRCGGPLLCAPQAAAPTEETARTAVPAQRSVPVDRTAPAEGSLSAEGPLPAEGPMPAEGPVAQGSVADPVK
jgi:SAM-dependent methyltransferase